MLITEYKIVMPLTLAEYQIGQLHEVIEASKHNTGGGSGFEWVTSEPREDCNVVFQTNFKEKFFKSHYTCKFLHLSNMVPNLIKMLSPTGTMEIREDSYNAFPYIHTSYHSNYMKDNFRLTVDSIHLEDKGATENVHQLNEEELKVRKVIKIDLASEMVQPSDITPETDPKLFKSVKTGRGPLKEGWMESQQPVMCCYKLVRCKFKWFGLEDKIENSIMKSLTRVFGLLHREIFCSIDKWIDLKIEDIRELEEKTRQELCHLRQTEEYKGITVKE